MTVQTNLQGNYQTEMNDDSTYDPLTGTSRNDAISGNKSTEQLTSYDSEDENVDPLFSDDSAFILGFNATLEAEQNTIDTSALLDNLNLGSSDSTEWDPVFSFPIGDNLQIAVGKIQTQVPYEGGGQGQAEGFIGVIRTTFSF